MTRSRRTVDPTPVTARIEDIGERGRGVARVDGKVVFVDGGLPGERVRLSMRKRRRRFDEAVVLEVLEPSPDRVEPRCPHFGRCGGCSLQHLAPAAQLALKQRRLLEALTRIGGVEPETVGEPIAGAVWGYRRRARLGVKHVPGKGGVLVGFRERNSAFVAEIDACEVLDPGIGHRLTEMRDALDALDARDRIPQIEVSLGDEAGAMVVRHLDPLTAHDRERLGALGAALGLEVYLQPGGPDTVVRLGGSEVTAPLSYRLPDADVTLAFEPSDFVQVNGGVNRALVARAVEALALEGTERVLDLFCGIGNFTLAVARAASAVTGLEGSVPLVERARANAHANGCRNAAFEVADLTQSALAERWLGDGWDRLLLDPPRSGALEVVQAMRPPFPARVVYVSCHPASLARDAAVLVGEHGYRLARAGVVDMFPHTDHVEAMAVFVHPGAADG
ncbi:MAG: 23S rRNA (uracil(1939)-C(5))-methyltransferase RlmD [Ectothiorhodospiraceae bacterium]|nr:23S rRNA (uracil(1939)-C(5))-methyltransferase RlmD [Chromatiales bacterium]MCP5157120.1 23S rRNA (uracil(1939)-C(5))-methyltransferase RlmD [Ectothiorhodospiraceae bacterium]